MKFTLWERNNIHALVGNMKIANARQLETIQSLREKFRVDDEKEWQRYGRLSVLGDDQISDDQRQFVKEYGEKLHSDEVEVKLTKSEFRYIADLITGEKINLPAQPGMIEHSLAFVKKMRQKKEEAEEI